MGAYRIPSETGLLISSGYIRYGFKTLGIAVDCHRGHISGRDTRSNFSRKKRQGVQSEVVGKICLPLAQSVALLLSLVAGCGNTEAQATKTRTSKTQSSHTAVSCTKDSQCPSGQRCGFTGGCESKGKCIVPSKTNHCIDPGGRCGCDGRPVDIFCGLGSRTEFTSAPVNAVGPCPRPCTEELGCGSSGLVCDKGFCVKPQRLSLPAANGRALLAKYPIALTTQKRQGASRVVAGPKLGSSAWNSGPVRHLETLQGCCEVKFRSLHIIARHCCE